jgi:hypothetical protein
MAKAHSRCEEPTAVDDVRRVREKIARQHHGNLHEHILETNRIAAALRRKLGLKTIRAPRLAKARKASIARSRRAG